MRRALFIAGICLGALAAPLFSVENPEAGRELCKKEFDSYRTRVRSNPTDEKLWREFRACVSELKRWTDGELVASQVIKQNPSIAEAYLLLGIAQMHTKDYPHAVDSLDESIRLKPTQSPAYYYLGMAYLYQNKTEEAAKAAQRATELDPQSAPNFSQLAYALFLNDDQAGCEAAAKKAIALDANSVAAYKVLGNLYAKQGKQAEADKLFEEAIHANGRIAAANPVAALPGMAPRTAAERGAVAAGAAAAAAPAIAPGPSAREAPAPEAAGEEESPASKDEIETRLIIRWRDMKEAAINGEWDKALSYFSDYADTRNRYRQSFQKMGSERVKQVFSSMSDIGDCEIVFQAATCSLNVSSAGTINVTKVRFEKNPDKVWRIRSF